MNIFEILLFFNLFLKMDKSIEKKQIIISAHDLNRGLRMFKQIETVFNGLIIYYYN